VRIVFFGSPEFAVPSLQLLAGQHDVALVVSQPDRPAGRGRALTPPPVKQLAGQLGIPIEQPVRLKETAFHDRLRALQPDLFVVVAYGRILPPALLAVPRLGSWNVHASLLPAYRGAAPIQWAIIRGETCTGVSIMRMEEGLDTGPVAARREEPISDVDTAGTLSDRLSRIGAELLLATLPPIERGEVAPETQDETRASLAPLLQKTHGLIDFERPARLVSAQARGVDPWPGPTAILDGEPVKLFRPSVTPGRGLPGEVLASDSQGLLVACGEGAVAFAELQLSGRKRLPAAAVLAGRAIPVGSRLRGIVEP
jgi:methionyl-tRNA formyltransferase